MTLWGVGGGRGDAERAAPLPLTASALLFTRKAPASVVV